MLPPFSLSQTLIGAIFVVYLVGIVSSTWFGRLADRHGRGTILSGAAQGYKAQAASLYLLVYYLGSSVLGSLGGRSWSAAGWTGVAELAGGLLVVALAISAWLKRGQAMSVEASAGHS